LSIPSIGRPRTRKEVGELFGVSERTVRRWTNDRHLECFRQGHTVRVTDEHIEAFIASRSVDAIEAPAPKPHRNPKYADPRITTNRKAAL
jgi:excisionase family DNA binding protein